MTFPPQAIFLPWDGTRVNPWCLRHLQQGQCQGGLSSFFFHRWPRYAWASILYLILCLILCEMGVQINIKTISSQQHDLSRIVPESKSIYFHINASYALSENVQRLKWVKKRYCDLTITYWNSLGILVLTDALLYMNVYRFQSLNDKLYSNYVFM